VAEGGYLHLNQDVLEQFGLSKAELTETIGKKEREVEERVKLFRRDRPRPELRDRTVILVDDGIATGGTVRAAIGSIRTQHPKAIVLAVPVAGPEAIEALTPEVDRVVCLRRPADLYAIGLWYADFTQVHDDEVIRILDRARREQTEVEHAAA
jgi:putative phosphoribosyl transferase